MASVDKRPNGKYLARWREYPGGPQKSRSFDRKRDADQFLVGLQHDQLVGKYVDPRLGRTTTREYYTEWVARQNWRPRTLEGVEAHFRLHVLPTFGDRPLSSLKRADIERWAKRLKLSPGSVRATYQHFMTMLNAAVADGLLARNVCTTKQLPKLDAAPIVPPSMQQVSALIDAAPRGFRTAVVLAAGAGLRSSEIFGVCVDRIDFLRRTLRVDQQLSHGTPRLVALKTDASYRTVPLPDRVLVELAEHLRTQPASDGLVFHVEGVPVDHRRAHWLWTRTTRAAGVTGVRFHDLRHFYASSLLSAGISIKAVQSNLGHGMASITLDTYGHLMPSDDDRSRIAMDHVFRAAEDFLRTEAQTAQQ